MTYRKHPRALSPASANHAHGRRLSISKSKLSSLISKRASPESMLNAALVPVFPIHRYPSFMTRLVIVPGWRDAGPAHWQKLWTQRFTQAVRVEHDDCISPTRRSWVAAVTRTILQQPGQVVIAAHHLGCIAVMHLPPEAVARIQGALLVAPADPERRAVFADFAPVPSDSLPYRNILVASAHDPWCPIRLAGAYARGWGSEFVRLHTGVEPPQDRRRALGTRRNASGPPPAPANTDLEPGHGEWPLGVALLQSLAGDRPFTARQPVPPASTASYLNLELV